MVPRPMCGALQKWLSQAREQNAQRFQRRLTETRRQLRSGEILAAHTSPPCIRRNSILARGTSALELPPCPQSCSECTQPLPDTGMPALRCAWSRPSSPAVRPMPAKCPAAFRGSSSLRPGRLVLNRHATRRAASAASESLQAASPDRTADEPMNCIERSKRMKVSS